MASASTHLAPVSLELGGKGANIVFEDADIDNAVYWAVEAIFRNAGQICLAGSRLFVHSSHLRRVHGAVRRGRRGADHRRPVRPGHEVLARWRASEHFDKVVVLRRSRPRRWAARIHTGGVADDGSWVVRPTIIDGLAAGCRAVLRGDLRPGLRRQHASTPRTRSLHLANDTRYGLNAMLFTENLSRAHRVASKLRAGTVWVNCFFIRDLRTPFGGVGDSGVGREGGNFSREFFTEPKAVVMQIDRG